MKGPKGAREPSAKHGRGRRFRVSYRDPNGDLKQPLFHRKADAEAFDLDVRSRVARGEYLDRQAGKATLREFADAWISQQIFEEGTRETVETRLRTQVLRRLGDKELVAIKAATVQGFVRSMQTSGHAPRYIQTITGLLSTILAAAVDDGRIPKNPCSATSVRLPTIKVRKVVPWTVGRVLAVAGEMPDPFEASIHLGYGLGLRQGEILGLALGDIDFLGRVVHVTHQICIVRNTLVFAAPKGGKERDVPLPDAVGLRLSAHLQAYSPVSVTLPWLAPDGPPVTAALMFSRANGAIHRSWFNRGIWEPALKRAGVEQEGMHVLRHTFASTMLADGVDIRAVAEYLGHKDPGFTLRIYTHLMPKVEDKARAAIDAAYRQHLDHRAQIRHRSA